MSIDLDVIAKGLGLDKKYNKLKKNPELFVKDMVFKRTAQLKKYIPIKYEGQNNFTIVSAVYNVSKYLDEYFESIVKQSLNFKKHIQIICVDDGSTDHSAEIIKIWQKKYPKNIHYIYKENGGQASARNLGMEHVKTEWVTFTDPDDYLHVDYFKNIDESLVLNKNINMLVTNILFYIEKEDLVKDGHSLNFRFKENQNIMKMRDLQKNINLSASTTLFKSDLVKRFEINFDDNVKPVFEDGKFISDYMLYCNNGEVNFLKNAVYYYRKREDGSSTLDTAWGKPEKYYNVIKYGHLNMLEAYKAKLGYVPIHIQRTTLYDISWYVKHLLNNSNKVSFLTDVQKHTFLELIYEIFTYIDVKTILEFDLAGIWFFQKVGMLGMFKKTQPDNLIVYIENIDREKKQILLSYFTYFDMSESFQFNGIDILPVYEKNTVYDFIDEKFVIERRIWVPYTDENTQFEVILNRVNAKISLNKKQHKAGVKVKDILEAYKPSVKYVTDGSFMLMDRDVQADDNAEHLYRYIKENHSDQKIYFALRRDSHDWDRLKLDGFNLVEYGSSYFEIKLRSCSKIISSHLDRYVNNYFGDEYEYSKKFIFLQHGLTKDDMSNWFNSKKNLQCLITASPFEYESIVGDNNHYKLTEKEVVLTGFPRHDSLLKKDVDKKIILIMPTWRNSIVGKTVGQGNTRELNDEFMQTFYAQAWYEFLHSPKLKNLVDHYGYTAIFAPHANITPYLDQFNVPNFISIWSASDSQTSMQKLFQDAKIMITDYSSVAFEMAYLQKAVIYFQFDRDNIFAGNHIYQKGYFDYEEDGFGPVIETVDETLDSLDTILMNDGRPLTVYSNRMSETFPFRDGRCCERVYNAILNLDSMEQETISLERLLKSINTAALDLDYSLVECRCSKLVNEYPEVINEHIVDLYGSSLILQKKWAELKEFLNFKYNIGLDVELAFAERDWTRLIALLEPKVILNQKEILYVLYSHMSLKNVLDFNDLLKKQFFNLDGDFKKISTIFESIILEKWDNVIFLVNEILIFENENIELSQLIFAFKLKVHLAYAYRSLGYIKEASNITHGLDKNLYENEYMFILEKAHIQYADEQYNLSRYWYNKLYSEYGFSYFDEVSVIEYSNSLIYLKDWDVLKNNSMLWIEKYPSNDLIKKNYLNALIYLKCWKMIRDFYLEYDLIVDDYTKILATYRLGLVSQAYDLIEKPTYESSYDYWKLVAEIAILEGDTILVRECHKGMLSIFPENLNNTIQFFNLFSSQILEI
ncbi:CDP-glycerol glycerophosphotransferase family protein [Acinetobacter sp. MD2]|uniref:CDP-glycerol glycerophosphotransferase family protein n=1 Tax=Acinetobacter sp. MD2 TaxID=2600066 RepID=UPI002D1F2F9B|nr:CDP-glycerol glycerophosphotransferase family protein [Acinetobacter sp. MD2]MEB3767531.1 CDP-glycerol glycerophosphotransferase family protein [Acinetobacter sp. MD2]